MSVFKGRVVVQLARGVKAFLNYEAGLTRGPVPPPWAETPGFQKQDRELAQLRQELAEARHRITEKEERVARLQSALSVADPESVVDPARMVWIFGTGRTGSTWLSRMMSDLPDHHTHWNEPLFGKLFGDFYYSLREDKRTLSRFILGDPPEARRAIIRSFVLKATALRYPAFLEGGYLPIKEPGGSIGAPLLMEALPESRMIFLIRDLRDSLASYMDALKPGGWMYKKRPEHNQAEIAKDQGQIKLLRKRVEKVTNEVLGAKEAYDNHRGPKVMVKYEELRADTFGTMKRIYSTLGIPVDEEALARVIEEHSWENVPERKKGPGKSKRKAALGTWKDDLTPQQARIVEDALTPLVREFYPS